MIYPSITTTKDNYLNQINEAEKLGINELCLFLTCLDLPKRRQFYQTLEKSSINKIPLVHLRHDMEPWELDYLWQKFQVSAFNIHPQIEYPIIHNLAKYQNRIFVEIGSAHLGNFSKETAWEKNYAGICIDFTHLEDTRLREPKIFADFTTEFGQTYCGCAHIGPIEKIALPHSVTGIKNYQTHYFTKLTQFDYLKNYPQKYFPEIIALEVENSLKEQLEAIKYLQSMSFCNHKIY